MAKGLCLVLIVTEIFLIYFDFFVDEVFDGVGLLFVCHDSEMFVGASSDGFYIVESYLILGFFIS